MNTENYILSGDGGRIVRGLAVAKGFSKLS